MKGQEVTMMNALYLKLVTHIKSKPGHGQSDLLSALKDMRYKVMEEAYLGVDPIVEDVEPVGEELPVGDLDSQSDTEEVVADDVVQPDIQAATSDV